MSESTSQLIVGAKLDGSFEETTKKVKRQLKDLGDEAKKADDEFKGFGKEFGKEVPPAVQKVDQATKSLISSIQRTTAVMDSGAKGSAEYYKALANQRGVDANVLKPYLDQLDAVKAKQAQAAAAMLTGSQSLDKIGMSAAATANALRGVPAQFTDIVTSIQGGQAPLTVFLQQGGQLKDMFGGAGNAAKALGGYVLGLINPYTLAAGAAAGLAIAYEQGAAESRAFNSALILSGNQAGVTTGQLMAMASSIDQISGTQGAAAEALALFASSGKIGAENLEKFTLTAIRFEKVTGTAIGDTVKKFEELRKAPLEATLKLNETMGYLTQTVYDQIKALTEQGRITEAAAVAQSEFDKATESMTSNMEKNLGTVQSAWMKVKGAVAETWDAIKGIGRDAGLEGQVAAAQKMVDIRRQAASSIYGNASDLVKLSEAENQLKGYQELLKNQQLSAQYAAERTASVKSQVEFDKESDKYLSKAVQMQQAIAAAQERFSKVSQTPENLAKYSQEIEGIQKKFEEAKKKVAAVSIVGETEVAGIKARIIVGEEYLKALKSEGIAAKEKNEGEKLAIKIQKELEGGLKGVALANKQKALSAAQSLASVLKETDALKELLTAQKNFDKQRDKEISGQEASIVKMEEKALAMEDEVRMYGLGKEAIEKLSISRLQERADILAGFDSSSEQVKLIEKEIDARKRLAIATDNKTRLDVGVQSAKEAAAEWKRTADSINNTLTDALMRGFESGKDFAKNMRDTVVNMFKTMVLRPIISAVINPVAGALTGALGLSGAAQAAGTGGSVLSSVGTIAGLASTFGAGLKAGFAGLMGEAGLMGTLSAGTTALGAGNIAGGLGTLAGPLALATAAILGLSAIIKATSGETRNGAAYGVGADGKASLIQGPSGGEIASVQARQMFDATKASIEGMLTAFGSKAVLTGFTAGLESSDNGKGFAYATGQINGVAFGDQNTYMNSRGDKTQEQALKDYQLELTQSILEGLQVTEDIPASIAKLISDGLNGSEVKSLSLEATRAILANVETMSKQVNTFGAAMTQLPFESLKNLSFDATAGLIAAAGGFDKLDASLGSYYANFYTADEQRAQSIKNLDASFSALGKTMPTLDEAGRNAYRSMVQLASEQDLTVEANAKAYAGLLALNPAMNALAPAIDSVATSAAEAAAAMTSAWASVMQSRGVAANDVTRFTAQAAIDAAFTQFKKTDKFGIANASQFQTITQADFANYSAENQKLIATILTGFSDLAKANAPVVDASPSYTAPDTSYTAPDTSIADAIDQITKGLTDAGASLGVELLKAQGKTAEAMEAQQAIDTAGYNAAQIAIYEHNQSIRDEITALGEAAAAKAAFDGKLKTLQQQYDDLTLTQAQKRNAVWLSLNAQDPSGSLSGAQIKIWDAQDKAMLAKATTDFNRAMLQAAGNTSGLAAFDQAVADAARIAAGWTQAQVDSVNAMTAATTATSAAATAAAAAAAAYTAARDAEIKAAQDQLKASLQTAMTQAQSQADAFANFETSLRKFAASTLTTAQELEKRGYAASKTAFAQDVALSLTGDQSAMESLQQTGADYLAASKAQAGSRLDYMRDVLTVASGANSAADAASNFKSVAEAQLDVLKQILGVLDPTTQSLSIGDAVANALKAGGAAAADALKVIGKLGSTASDGSSLPTSASAKVYSDYQEMQRGFAMQTYMLLNGGLATISALDALRLAQETQRAEFIAANGKPRLIYEASNSTNNATAGGNIPAFASMRPQSASDTSKLMQDMRDEIRQLRSDINQASTNQTTENRQIAINTMKTHKTLEKWDVVGQPTTRA